MLDVISMNFCLSALIQGCLILRLQDSFTKDGNIKMHSFDTIENKKGKKMSPVSFNMKISIVWPKS